MRSKLLIGALCVAVSVSAASVASAEVYSGKIAPDKTKVYSVTTDTSMILELTAIAFHERTDLDIMVTIKDGADDVVVLDSASAMTQLEKGTVGVAGATEVTIMVTNADGPLSRFALLITQPADTGVGRGAAIPATYVGEFGLDEPVHDARLQSLQKLVRERAGLER